jgi:hypothetical protein
MLDLFSGIFDTDNSPENLAGNSPTSATGVGINTPTGNTE